MNVYSKENVAAEEERRDFSQCDLTSVKLR